MASLVQSFSGDTALRLNNEECVRKIIYGTSWRKLHIAVHHAVPAVTAGITANLYIGVCEGSVNTFKSATCVDWAGGVVGGGGGWTYDAGPPAGITVGSNNPRGATKVNTTVTTTNGAVADNCIGKTNRDWFTFEITKTATGFTLITRTPSVIPATDITPANFAMIAAQENEPASPAIDVTYSGNYLWDHVSIYWDDASTNYEISEIQALRLA